MAQVLTKPVDPYPEHRATIIIPIVSIVIIDVRLLIIRIEVHDTHIRVALLLMKPIRFENAVATTSLFFSPRKG